MGGSLFEAEAAFVSIQQPTCTLYINVHFYLYLRALCATDRVIPLKSGTTFGILAAKSLNPTVSKFSFWIMLKSVGVSPVSR